MSYQQSFISLDNETFTLRIDGVTPSVALPLSDDPISTDEDSDSDMFMPIAHPHAERIYPHTIDRQDHMAAIHPFIGHSDARNLEEGHGHRVAGLCADGHLRHNVACHL